MPGRLKRSGIRGQQHRRHDDPLPEVHKVQVEVNIRSVGMSALAEAAARLEATGVDVVADSEVRRDPFLTVALLAATTSRVGLASAVTIAFARSPMVVAYGARNLNEMTCGRFHLGVGTQVKRHILRRFSARWESPGPMLRDYLQALRDTWYSWENTTPLAHESANYTIDLMTPEFDLGPDPFRPIPIEVAAVNSFNVGVAASLGDAIRLHAFSTPDFVRRSIVPTLVGSAALSPQGAGRPFDIIGGGFIATAVDEEGVVSQRAAARRRIAFYGSTRTYLAVLETHGWTELGTDLRALADAGRWEEMAGIVPDEVVDEFVTSGTYDEIASKIESRYGGILTRVQLPCPPDDADWDAFGAMLERVHRIPNPSTLLEIDSQ
jgi:probable F420-dependent oxidoreductase